ncbi:NAD(P)/FAD-dependent oxidoreductase [Halolamina sp. CBA1230]|uniref:dihydrolipoyl dehydrogenase family protein n=1 Tax=Halolamina sp. CBA1230 TaxID=1853690 RepID=UPI0009A23FA4|nr:NAD(P)/FAD-dependent oxidoreductase [Halolamina sp. CBA1230]QKY21121.1 NAD(P)/FAD-dependent oxidoreductase [Halolamina sp. CBA1230]
MHVVIIGAYGSAGVAVADGLVDHVGGEIDRLTLVDDGEPGGGLCILRGCMPSKEVLSAAAHRYQARADHRLDGGAHEMDLESIVDTKDDHVLGFAEHRRGHVHDLAEREGVEFVHATARLDGADRVELYEDGPGSDPTRTLDADYVAVSTGSTLNVPDLPGIEDVEYMDSADVLDATELPDSGVVMGFGYVGLEMVPYLAEAGVDLTVIEHDERPLDDAPPAFGDELLEMYREEFGVEILTTTDEKALEPTDDGVRLTCETDSGAERVIDAEELFLFTGRRPNVDGLGLETAGVDVGPGFVEDTMQAADAETLFFPGDVNDKEPLLHIAKEQGQLAAENILAHGRDEELEAFEFTPHHVMFTGAGVYPYTRVGHTAETAREELDDPIVTRRQASDDGVFKTKDASRGLAELVVARDGTVVGYQGLHYHADAMAKTMQVIVEMGLDAREIPDRAFHPTTPEIIDGLLRDAVDRLD